jgi:L,D-transpeptidase catalytic domain
MAIRWLLISCLALSAWLPLASATSAEELVVDNSAPGVQVSGAWNPTALTEGFVGADYLARSGSAADGSVFWPIPPGLPPGRYEVSAWWTSGDNRATNAVYWIRSNTGAESVVRNQQVGGGAWQSLGSFEFQPGGGQGVTLTDAADGVVIADAVRWLSATDVPATTAPTTPSTPAPTAVPSPTAQPAAPAPAPAPPPDGADAVWTVTLNASALHAGPDVNSERLATVPQFSYLQILDYSGEWARVYDPRARGTAYIQSNLVGESSPPPAWVTAPPPPATASIEQMGRSVGNSPVAFYPVDDRFAYTSRLGHNVPILVHDRVQGADGSTWYRVDQGYLQAASVRLPRAPAQMLSGRWIDADLAEPAMLVAYEGGRAVRNMLAIKGTRANQTPTGTFTIGRRVADETMNSETLGVPRNHPDGYYLEHVLHTQYFTSDGASIHYNYWSSNFGYSGSHGCLGLNLADSEYMWNWASIGTRIVIHN